MSCATALHRLKVDSHVEDNGKEPRTKKEGKGQRKSHVSILEEPGWQGAFVTELELRKDEHDCEKAESNK